MPERTTIVKAKSQYGIKVEGDDDWWNWSKIEYRDEPFDTSVVAGDRVQISYNESEFEDVETGEMRTKVYISSIAKVTSAAPSVPSDGAFLADDALPPGQELWAKDRLRARTDCIACATGIYKSCIEAGIVKSLPTGEELIAYAATLEKWARE